jgi:hypothetical protein
VAATVASAYPFASQAQAQALAASVDSAYGYPIAGQDIGGGVHATATQSVTTTYFVPRQNPNTGMWWYLADGVTIPVLAPSAVTLGLPAPVALDGTWYAVSDAGIGSDAGVSLDAAVVADAGHGAVVIH